MSAVTGAQTLKVLRWSTLGAGAVYGFFHNRSLAQQAEETRYQKEWNRKVKLIDEAKAEWARKTAVPAGDVVTDLNDPKFDIEKFIDYSLKQ